MTSPVRSRDERVYTPVEPEELVCKDESTPEMTSESPSGNESDRETVAVPRRRDDATPSSSASLEGPDYLSVSIGAGAIIGGDLGLTLDRFGHLYLSVGAGVGLSATVANASIRGGQLVERPPLPSAEEKLGKFLEGDAVEVTASFIGEAGIANSAGGTAAEIGFGLVQASAQFQHNWRVLDLPVRW